MAFPTNTTLLDDFNRASLGSNWSNVFGTLTIQSNQLHGSASGALGYWNVETFKDAEVYATIVNSVPGSGGVLYLFARLTDAGGGISTTDGYTLNCNFNASGNETIEIGRSTNGANVVLVSTTDYNLSVGDKIGFSVIGNELKAYLDQGSGWAEILSTTDSTYTAAGYIGAGIVASAANLDNFSGGAPVGGGTTFNQSVSGTLTGGGALIRQTGKAITGDLIPSGVLVRQAARAIGGMLSPSGALIRQTGKVTDGALISFGALAALRTFIVNLTGTIVPTGALTKTTAKFPGGALSPVGTLSRHISRALGGILAFIGELVGLKQGEGTGYPPIIERAIYADLFVKPVYVDLTVEPIVVEPDATLYADLFVKPVYVDLTVKPIVVSDP